MTKSDETEAEAQREHFDGFMVDLGTRLGTAKPPNPDPLRHRVWVALRHSPTFVLCMTGATLLIITACLLFATAALWAIGLGLALLAVAEGLLWYGWRKGAI